MSPTVSSETSPIFSQLLALTSPQWSALHGPVLHVLALPGGIVCCAELASAQHTIPAERILFPEKRRRRLFTSLMVLHGYMVD